jgi:hypothetical protein
MINSLKSLESDISLVLHNFMVRSKKIYLTRDNSVQFVIQDFGLIVSAMDRMDYAQVKDIILNKFEGWRVVYISPTDNILEKKYDILWSLMRCGYMKWMRSNYPRQIERILSGPDNLGNRIINERLRIWAEKPKFNYLIEDNKAALKNNIRRELTADPSFFDYMPEEVSDV